MATLSLFDRDDDVQVCSVSELTAQIKATLEDGFAEVAVRGEISNLSRPRSGHVYLKLKDESAQVQAVLWKADARRVVFDLADGLAVRAWGRLSVYAPRGEYQVTIRKVEPEGIGALELAFRQVVGRLAAEGLFDPDRKRPLPPYPARIVVVTSPTGAAVRDLLQVVGRRWPAAEILIAPTRVQGVGASAEVAEAIGLANRVAGADFIVLARGGGSLEDLWTFNEEVVARAIFASELPVVSAVGHEVDVTVADLVADVRALTPSEAGERCVPDAREVARLLARLGERLREAGRANLDEARDRIDDLAARAARALDGDLRRRVDRLARAAATLQALNPMAVLARGYSLTTLDGSPTPIRSAGRVEVGALIRTRLADGELVARVERSTVGSAP